MKEERKLLWEIVRKINNRVEELKSSSLIVTRDSHISDLLTIKHDVLDIIYFSPKIKTKHDPKLKIEAERIQI